MKFDIPDLNGNMSGPESYIPGAIWVIVVGGGIFLLFIVSLF